MSETERTRTGGTRDNGRPDITPRQREVLRLLADGLSMREAGLVLNITPRTVAFHKYQMMAQLDLKSNAALIQYAVRERHRLSGGSDGPTRGLDVPVRCRIGFLEGVV